MEHIDEGTIHAWLDGALPPDEGARIEAHVASCAECAAAVAEARGLIAASSRILAALDDVPRGVIPVAVVTGESVTPESVASTSDVQKDSPAPAREVVASSGDTKPMAPHVSRAAGRASRRPWYRRPQWAAAAGISFLAVTLTAVWQRGGAPGVMDSMSERAASAPAPMVAAEQAASPAASGAAEPTAGVSANSPSSPTQEKVKTSAARRDAASSNEQKALAAPTEARKELASTANRTVQDGAASASGAAGAANAAGASARERDVARAAPVPAAPPPSVAAASADVQARQAPDSLSAKRVNPSAVDAITRSESARVAAEARLQRSSSNLSLEQVVTTGTSSSAARRSPIPVVGALTAKAAGAATMTPSALAGCYRLQPSDVAQGVGIRSLLQLDFAGAGSDEARPAYAARDLAAGNVQSAMARDALRWTLSTDGAVVLVRGEGASARRVTLRIGVPLDSLAAQQLQGTRVPCPER